MNSASDIQVPDTLERFQRYWTETLLPFTPTPGVPPDFVRGTAPGARVEVDVPLSPALAARAVHAAQAKPSLLLAQTIAACVLLLHRQHQATPVSLLTPVTDPRLGDAAANRWLIVKTAIAPEETLDELFVRVAGTLGDAFAHQAFPFAQVLELLGRSWTANRAPACDIAVAFAGVSDLDALRDIACDVILCGEIARGALRLRLSYRTDLFTPDSIEAVGRQLAHVVSAIVEAPSTRVRDVPLLTPAEDAAALARLRAWDRRPLPDARVEALIEAVAAREPDRDAFVHGETRVTYGALVRQARALARRLRDAGAVDGQFVAIAADSSLALPVALLATLYTGAAFVPLDPRHPTARLRALVTRVAPMVVLADPRLRAVFDGIAPTLDWPSPIEADEANDDACEARARGGAEAPAYVMFTSGSTGTPNGVVVSHRSLVNYLLWARERYLGTDRPTFALYSSIAFDLTLTSVFLPLIAGCTTIIADGVDGRVDVPAVFADPRIGVVKATPSHLKLLRPAELRESRVRRVIVGGEACDRTLIAALQDALTPDAAIFNEYGPTEATIACTAHRFSDRDPVAGTVPLGETIWNAGVYLLDADRRPTPTGAVGEIWISGEPVARGYLHDPERTAERFVDDPFVPGARMYRTGDRARRDAGGRLYYLGRVDDQVKVNGIRIELGDVRAAMNRVPRVRDSIVRLAVDERGESVLIAYYVARQPIDVSIVRAALLDALPQEMLPHLFVRMAKLPLTLNGKVDVERLPSLEEARRAAPQPFAPPRTPTEQTLAAVWREVLGLGEISIHSNFFEVGGHSLLASQVAWQIESRLGREMPLRWLFDTPTIAQIAERLDTARPGAPIAVADAADAKDGSHDH